MALRPPECGGWPEGVIPWPAIPPWLTPASPALVALGERRGVKVVANQLVKLEVILHPGVYINEALVEGLCIFRKLRRTGSRVGGRVAPADEATSFR